jgi:hypothetical protein
MAVRTDQQAHGRRDGGEGRIVGQVSLVGAELDPEQGAGVGAQPFAERGREFDPSVVSGRVAPERLHRGRRPAGLHGLQDQLPHRRAHCVEVVEQAVEPRLVQDRPAHRLGMTNQQTQREVSAAARAEHRRRADAERIQQGRRIVGLLLRRGRRPVRGGGTASVAAPVIGDDGELVGQQVGEGVQVAAVPGRPHDQ